MITASVVLYKTSLLDLTNLINSVISKVQRLYIIDNYPDGRYSEIIRNISCVEYIKNRNLGYGVSHNIALRNVIAINSDYHIILNPDVYFDPKIIDSIVHFMEQNRDVVNVLPKVYYPNGEIQYLAKKLPNPIIMFARRFLPMIGIIKHMNDNYELRHSGYDTTLNVPCLSGCFMFLRLSVIKKNSLFFDNRFFMYYEDYDLNRRCHRVGKTIFFPKVTIIHNHAREAYTNKKLLLVFILSTFKYFNKYGWFFDSERKLMNNQVEQDITLQRTRKL